MKRDPLKMAALDRVKQRMGDPFGLSTPVTPLPTRAPVQTLPADVVLQLIGVVDRARARRNLRGGTAGVTVVITAKLYLAAKRSIGKE